MDKNVLDFFFTFLFSKKSLIFLTFLDFPDRVEILPLLVEIPKFKNQYPQKFHEFFMNSLEIPLF